jgi:nucleotide-binding universal stress UspA family protein
MVNSEKNILLVISTTRESPKTIAYALRRAQELGGRLTALCVIDTSLPVSIVEKLSDSGFVGDKPGEEVYEEILEEYRQRGTRKLAEIAQAAEKNHIPVKTLLKKGDLVLECLEAIDTERAAVVIVGRKKMSKLSQFIFGSPIKKIEKNAKCPVEVIEES